MDEPTERDLAASEWNHVTAPPGRYDPQLVPAPPLRRLSASLIDWALILCVGGPIAHYFTYVLVGYWYAGTDEFIQWLFLSAWGVLAVAYGYVEAFGRVTIGKKLLRLRLVDVVAPPPGRGWRFTLRWGLSWLPLLALVFSCVGITSHASTLTWASLDSDLLYLPAALLGASAMQAILAVACIASPWRMTPWERLTGIEVRHVRLLPERAPHPGFDVIPAGDATPTADAPPAAP